MSGGHTPGPWSVVEGTEHHGFYVTSDFGNTICDLYAMSRPGWPSTANGGDSRPVPFMHEMDGPNARLIAAAPDLLEACERAAKVMDDKMATVSELIDTVKLLRAAITLARTGDKL